MLSAVLFIWCDQDSQNFYPSLILKLPDNGLGHEFLRLKIEMNMKVSRALRCCGTDRGNLRGANLARIVVKFEKHFEKSVHVVRAGEHDPIVSVRVLHELAECAQVGWRFNSDGGQFKNVGPERTQLIA